MVERDELAEAMERRRRNMTRQERLQLAADVKATVDAASEAYRITLLRALKEGAAET